MSKQFVEKNIKLSLEFDRYVSKNPQVFKKIPNGACVVFTERGKAGFNKNSRVMAEKVSARSHQKCIEARKEGSRWILQPMSA